MREGLENETRGRLTIRCPCKGSDGRVVEEGTVHIAAIAVPHLCDQELTLSLFAATWFLERKTLKQGHWLPASICGVLQLPNSQLHQSSHLVFPVFSSRDDEVVCQAPVHGQDKSFMGLPLCGF